MIFDAYGTLRDASAKRFMQTTHAWDVIKSLSNQQLFLLRKRYLFIKSLWWPCGMQFRRLSRRRPSKALTVGVRSTRFGFSRRVRHSDFYYKYFHAPKWWILDFFRFEYGSYIERVRYVTIISYYPYRCNEKKKKYSLHIHYLICYRKIVESEFYNRVPRNSIERQKRTEK